MEREEPRPLDAQLERVTASLNASLEEACSTDVKRLDTGELVRIKEVLVVATEAAKEAVALRRRRGAAERPRRNHSADMHPAAEHRRFVDERGVSWDAFAVLPTAEPRGLARLPEQYQQGWLCFESATEKRRLGPIPDAWQTVTDDALRRLRDTAQPVQHRPLPDQRENH
jgi:hypothetical protein